MLVCELSSAILSLWCVRWIFVGACLFVCLCICSFCYFCVGPRFCFGGWEMRCGVVWRDGLELCGLLEKESL